MNSTTPDPQTPGATRRKSFRLTLDLPHDQAVALIGEARAAGISTVALFRAMSNEVLQNPPLAAKVIAAAKADSPSMKHPQHVSTVQRLQVIDLHLAGHDDRSIARLIPGLAPSTVSRVLGEEVETINARITRDPAETMPTHDPAGPYGHRVKRPTVAAPPHTPAPTESTSATVHQLPVPRVALPFPPNPDGANQ